MISGARGADDRDLLAAPNRQISPDKTIFLRRRIETNLSKLDGVGERRTRGRRRRIEERRLFVQEVNTTLRRRRGGLQDRVLVDSSVIGWKNRRRYSTNATKAYLDRSRVEDMETEEDQSDRTKRNSLNDRMVIASSKSPVRVFVVG